MRIAGLRGIVLSAALIASVPAAAAAGSSPAGSAAHVRALDRMMAALGPESARASATTRTVYREHLDLLFLGEYGDLETALETGGVTPLPTDPLQFNVAPRLDGLHPIGEKDLSNQGSYIAARPAAVGALLEIASQVRSGPIEVTSLVRHGAYQDALKATNANASTSVPMHTLGLAFDIGLVNTPLRTVYELRDVLRRMQKAGDILVIGERRQLVFHVVPHPSRLGHFTDVYTRFMGHPSAARAVVVSAPGVPRAAATGGRPTVVTEVVAVLPQAGYLEDDRRFAAPGAVGEPDGTRPAQPTPAMAGLSPAVGILTLGGVAARSLLALLAALAAAAYRILALS